MEALRRFNGTPKKVLESAELMQLLLPTLRADLMINESYTYTVEPPLDCPITVFGGLQDPLVNRDDMEAWKEHTLSSFSLHLLPGDHFFINTAQYFLLQLINKTVTAGVK
ncbi:MULTISPECIES: thioesterase II family protein [Nostocales]|uniref:thioesterase II family protein n=1 Tax=Nostocales TaxID=1161 RepID=UPI00197A98C2|nr:MULTISPECIES: thioesterase [Nostocales]